MGIPPLPSLRCWQPSTAGDETFIEFDHVCHFHFHRTRVELKIDPDAYPPMAVHQHAIEAPISGEATRRVEITGMQTERIPEYVDSQTGKADVWIERVGSRTFVVQRR